MKRKCFLIMTTLLIILFSCQKVPETPKENNKISFGTTTSDSVFYVKVSVSVVVNALGGNDINQHGFCLGTAPGPDINGNHSSLGSLSGTDKFSEQISGLSPNTKYYIRPYVTYKYGILYGQQIEATTKQLTIPVVLTGNITDIKYNSAIVTGTINDDGGTTVTKRGMCWNIAGNPTLSNCIGSTDNGAGIGTYSSSLTLLTDNQTYFVVSYATNELGIAYGVVKQFSTLLLTTPYVNTIDVTNITSTSATCGGDVISNGNGTITARGVCWNKTGNPTLANSIGHTNDGQGTGLFTSNITGLNKNTTYYVTAYATNEKGTFYSLAVRQFIAQFICGKTIPHGGKDYQTIKIGDQCWFKENLNIGIRIEGNQEQTNNGTIEKYCYDDMESNCTEYGGLYQWDELMQYVTIQGAKGLCPDGWHVPTDEEWTMLTNYLGGEPVAGGKLKESGTLHWSSPNSNATNSSDFSALPGGYRHSNGYFFYLHQNAFFWSSTQNISDYVWSRDLDYNNAYFTRYYSSKSGGFSCRCLLD